MKMTAHSAASARRHFLSAMSAAWLLAAVPVRAQSLAMISRPGGGFRFLPGGQVFAGGAVAEPGFAVVHALLTRWLPLEQGYLLVERYLAANGRPMQALCGMELRLPRQLGVEEFSAFNTSYVARLEERSVLHEGLNPVSRTNVAPAFNPPAVPSLHAFTYTVPVARNVLTFCMSGMTERGAGGIVAQGDASAQGMQRKLAHVLAAVTGRLADLGVGWGDATHVDMYAAEEIPGAVPVLAAKALAAFPRGIRWHAGRPPVIGLELEMEARALLREEVVDA